MSPSWWHPKGVLTHVGLPYFRSDDKLQSLESQSLNMSCTNGLALLFPDLKASVPTMTMKNYIYEQKRCYWFYRGDMRVFKEFTLLSQKKKQKTKKIPLDFFFFSWQSWMSKGSDWNCILVRFISTEPIWNSIRFLLLLSFCLFSTSPAAYGGSQVRGLIRAVAAGLRHSYRHSHSNARSELHLRPTPQLTAMPDP